MIKYRKAVLDDVKILSSIRVEFLSQANDTFSGEDSHRIEKACTKYFKEALKMRVLSLGLHWMVTK